MLAWTYPVDLIDLPFPIDILVTYVLNPALDADRNSEKVRMLGCRGQRDDRQQLTVCGTADWKCRSGSVKATRNSRRLYRVRVRGSRSGFGPPVS